MTVSDLIAQNENISMPVEFEVWRVLIPEVYTCDAFSSQFVYFIEFKAVGCLCPLHKDKTLAAFEKLKYGEDN